MIHPGEYPERPCVGGIYEDRLGDSLHIYVFVYASSYINSQYGKSNYSSVHETEISTRNLSFLSEKLLKLSSCNFSERKYKVPC